MTEVRRARACSRLAGGGRPSARGVADRRTAVLSLTAAGADMVASWQRVNADILTVALGSLEPASRQALAMALPALRELTGAVDSIADNSGDESQVSSERAG